MRGFHIRVQVNSQSGPDNTRRSATFTPKSLFQPLPSHSPSPTIQRRNTLRYLLDTDYRYGPIRIDWVDFQEMNPGSGTHAGKEVNYSTPVAAFIPTTSSKSGSTNLPDGIVHIFREGSNAVASSASTSTLAQPGALQSHSLAADENSTSIADDACATVAVLAVPPWMNTSDFLAFVAPASEGMAHLRLIRDTSPNRTMVVIQFREPSSATEFIEEFNGRPFNSVEPETCNIVRVKSIKIDIDEPVPLAITRLCANPGIMYELPTCPVCLDRMDSAVTGLVTVPCSHTFHCMCLSKWGDSRCPVCRYSQNALSSASRQTSSTSTAHAGLLPISSMSTCSECDSDMNLWICLICGKIGCSRQGLAHAKKHYELTSHLYALELETQRVWDYAGDNYVHRLIQSKADGKLVELPSASGMDAESNARSRTGQGPGADDNLKAEKVEMMAMQYSQILQRALDDQRESYEAHTAELKKGMEEARRKLEFLTADLDRQLLEAQHDRQERKKEEEARAAAEKQKAKLEKKAERLDDLARRLEKELKEERAVSEGMMKNLAKMKEKSESAEREKAESAAKVVELEDQLRDVMFFLEARTRIEQGEGVESEAAGGAIELPPPPVSPPSNAPKRKKKAK